uniref:Uncharacterized protein n=1 Tax=Hyaloperonospora arabidopsidis (strain Emoy2) TaxID=559515 RepID=M4BRR6_HYAAE
MRRMRIRMLAWRSPFDVDEEAVNQIGGACHYGWARGCEDLPSCSYRDDLALATTSLWRR